MTETKTECYMDQLEILNVFYMSSRTDKTRQVVTFVYTDARWKLSPAEVRCHGML